VIIKHLQQRQAQTLLIVSHRLSAIEQADDIIVMSHGSIIERGNHQQLTAGDGWYSRMAAYQQMEQAMENAS
jgi:ATP-binding cassette subfamily B protein/ATP-binding cassette subfamily C protein/ATP-binding cassette subfamily B multidrug efflux pump